MSRRLRLLDLFSGAGGAAMGYHRAGFDVVGVDIAPQPNYPFAFVQMNALDALRLVAANPAGFDAIHASPPCQHYSNMTKVSGKATDHPDFVAIVRQGLRAAGVAYVIENVVGAPLIDPVRLCGSSFGLRLQRHRLFESNVPIDGKPCDHESLPEDIRIMNRGWKMTRFVPVYGSSGCKARHLWNEAMGIEWMTTKELTEAIPPAYTEWIGGQIADRLKRSLAA